MRTAVVTKSARTPLVMNVFAPLTTWNPILRSPTSAALRCRSRGISPTCSHSASFGAISRSEKDRAIWLSARRSGVVHTSGAIAKRAAPSLLAVVVPASVISASQRM
ncbi:Uncharacterised protein [Mycobacteroides abscessus subsp. abscessus]|nr:Uncharacterised protein [Mycobacteroides abscessus subsp. abscessus]